MFGKNVLLKICATLKFLHVVNSFAQKTWKQALSDCGRFGMSLVNLQDPKFVLSLRELTKSGKLIIN